MTDQTPKAKPADKLFDGNISVTIWRNFVEDKNGQAKPRYVVKSPVVFYTDDQNQPKETTTLHDGEILKAQRLLVLAYDRRLELIREDKAQAEAENQPQEVAA